MELTLHNPGDHYFIRSVGPEGITINETLCRDSLIVSANELVRDWPVGSMEDLNPGQLQPVLDLKPEIVLLGTGRDQLFPPPEIMMACYSQGIGIEAMTTEAACRTFNVLLSEDRNVVAALIALGGGE